MGTPLVWGVELTPCNSLKTASTKTLTAACQRQQTKTKKVLVMTTCSDYLQEVKIITTKHK